MSRNIEFEPEEYYHLYNRGTEKRIIFRHDKDRNRFLASLYVSNGSNTIHASNHQALTIPELLTLDRGEPLVDICAYCLMPNHFHLLVRERTEGGIARFMQKLLTGYTMYFNTINERSGALFQGKYKAEHADNDRYLKYLIAYIHLNPIQLIEPRWKEVGLKNRARAEQYLNHYRYSSFLDYCGTEKRAEQRILNLEALPEYFVSPNDFRTSVTEWLGFKS